MPISEGNESDVVTFLVTGNNFKYKILFFLKKKKIIYPNKPANKPWSTILKVACSVCLKEREKRREGEGSGKRTDGSFGGYFSHFYIK